MSCLCQLLYKHTCNTIHLCNGHFNHNYIQNTGALKNCSTCRHAYTCFLVNRQPAELSPIGPHSTISPKSREVSFMACQQHRRSDCALEPGSDTFVELLLTGKVLKKRYVQWHLRGYYFTLAPGRNPSGLLLHTIGEAKSATS